MESIQIHFFALQQELLIFFKNGTKKTRNK